MDGKKGELHMVASPRYRPKFKFQTPNPKQIQNTKAKIHKWMAVFSVWKAVFMEIVTLRCASGLQAGMGSV